MLGYAWWVLQKGEDVIDSARRELCEETGIDDAYVKLVGVYGEPGRDPEAGSYHQLIWHL
ncbi:MAG: NUDIX domain-containing protein [Coprococcus sp.]